MRLCLFKEKSIVKKGIAKSKYEGYQLKKARKTMK
jgi:hypothetical protein